MDRNGTLITEELGFMGAHSMGIHALVVLLLPWWWSIFSLSLSLFLYLSKSPVDGINCPRPIIPTKMKWPPEAITGILPRPNKHCVEARD
jgi:hypothetical protein